MTRFSMWMLVAFICSILAAAGYTSATIIAGDPDTACHPTGVTISADLQMEADTADDPCTQSTAGMVTP
jgi:hypothetical protein